VREQAFDHEHRHARRMRLVAGGERARPQVLLDRRFDQLMKPIVPNPHGLHAGHPRVNGRNHALRARQHAEQPQQLRFER
jgi:hypothetical protein